ncbi:MAG: outer membrane lipid asymmetry maintenance protein MlaD [Pseudomonadota bacterium]
MRESVFETLIGFAVLIAAGFFMWFALDRGGDSQAGSERYNVSARFNNVSGIDRGADVRLAGVKVGIVTDIAADFDRFEAKLNFAVDSALDLPDDTDARVTSDGLLGGAYIALEPGGSFDNIPKDGTGEIIYTRGSVDLLTLVGSFASSLGDESDTSPTPADDGLGDIE